MTNKQFDALCESYGLVRPTRSLNKCAWTFPESVNYSCRSFARKERVYPHKTKVFKVCFDVWYRSDEWGASRAIIVKNVKETRKALETLVSQYKEIKKSLRLTKLAEL